MCQPQIMPPFVRVIMRSQVMGGTVTVPQPIVDIVEKENLPEKSEELPVGALDFLE